VELRHLRYFVFVAEELHFGRAARRAGIAQPPLSQQIRSLEAELGVALFERTRRRVELTDAGRAMLPEARAVLKRADLAAQAARDGASGVHGRLAIGFAGSLAFGFVRQFLADYRQQYPGIRLDLRELTSEQQREALLEGTIDIGLVRYPVSNPEIVSERLFPDPLVVAVNSNHEMGRGSGPLAVGSLAHEPLVMFPRHYGPPFFDQVMRLCYDAGFTPEIVQEAVQMSTIVSLVSAGIGSAIVPGSARHLRLDGVTFRDLVDTDRSPALSDVYAIRSAASSSTVRDQALAYMRAVAALDAGEPGPSPRSRSR
jgi:DNA-binding transcriptional LysR family regulator